MAAMKQATTRAQRARAPQDTPGRGAEPCEGAGGTVGAVRGKYGNRKVQEDGYTFDSMAERAEYRTLKLRVLAGDIADLELQPRYPLVVNGVKVAVYVGDFRYRVVADGSVVVCDVKGVKTPVYRLKAKLMRACHGIEIVEV